MKSFDKWRNCSSFVDFLYTRLFYKMSMNTVSRFFCDFPHISQSFSTISDFCCCVASFYDINHQNSSILCRANITDNNLRPHKLSGFLHCQQSLINTFFSLSRTHTDTVNHHDDFSCISTSNQTKYSKLCPFLRSYFFSNQINSIILRKIIELSENE